MKLTNLPFDLVHELAAYLESRADLLRLALSVRLSRLPHLIALTPLSPEQALLRRPLSCSLLRRSVGQHRTMPVNIDNAHSPP